MSCKKDDGRRSKDETSRRFILLPSYFALQIVLTRSRTWSSTFAGSRANPPHSEDVLNIQHSTLNTEHRRPMFDVERSVLNVEVDQAPRRGVEPRGTGLESVCSPRSTPLCNAAGLKAKTGSTFFRPPTDGLAESTYFANRQSSASGAGRMLCLLFQFDVPVAFANEPRPAFDTDSA